MQFHLHGSMWTRRYFCCWRYLKFESTRLHTVLYELHQGSFFGDVRSIPKVSNKAGCLCREIHVLPIDISMRNLWRIMLLHITLSPRFHGLGILKNWCLAKLAQPLHRLSTIFADISRAGNYVPLTQWPNLPQWPNMHTFDLARIYCPQEIFQICLFSKQFSWTRISSWSSFTEIWQHTRA